MAVTSAVVARDFANRMRVAGRLATLIYRLAAKAAYELHKDEGREPSKYVEFEGVTACEKPLKGWSDGDFAVAHEQRTYKVEHIEEKPEKGRSRCRTVDTLINSDLQKRPLLVIDADAENYKKEIDGFKALVDEKEREARSFGSMLSRSKYLMELDALKEELEIKEKCKNVISVDPNSVNIKELMIKGRTTFEPPSGNVNVNVNLNSARRDSQYPKKTLEGYRIVDNVVPVGEPVYCLGKVTLNKIKNELTFSRDSSKPFVFQYGSSQSALANAEFHRSGALWGSYGFASAGASILAYSIVNYYHQNKKN